jgi:hypothetical protein
MKKSFLITIINLFLIFLSVSCPAQLVKAIRKGDIKEMEKLIAAGADVNKKSIGATPLYWAAYENSYEAARLLLDKGANIDEGMNNGWKPIHIAAKRGNTEVVKLLIDRGADIYATCPHGGTPLKLAEDYGTTLTIRLLQEALEKKNLTANNEMKTDAIVGNQVAVTFSDVDTDIPVSSETKPYTYALIIGNEDYSSYQTGLSSEVNVDFAINDAKIFKDYCIKTLGISEKQVKLITNATTGQMTQGIAWLSSLAKVDNGKAELIFYYSGHGLPDEETKEPYLIPVDISGNNVSLAIKLADVYHKLNEYPSQKVIVFLDACFSGGARNQGLIAMKGVKVRPKETLLNGNMVVLASSTGVESSGVYREKQHGYMTYYLLKKLQESKGNISYKELSDFVIEAVAKESTLNGKTQTPQLNYSLSVENEWLKWTFN